MAWVKLDDGFFRNPKIVAISPESKLIYLAGLCYAGAALTDGFIPENAVKMLASDANVASPQKRAKELVDAGLWVKNPRGYSVHDYLEHNSSASDVLAKREDARKRMQAKRAGSSREVRANSEGTSPEVHEPDTDTETEVERNRDKGAAAPIYTAAFESFWSSWPKGKGNKKKTFDVWKRLRPDADLQAVIIDRVGAWKQTRQWREGFITHSERWLRDRGWEDDLPEDSAGSLTIVGDPLPEFVTLEPGEKVTQVGDGAWDVTHSAAGYVRKIRPEWGSVIFDSRHHQSHDGQQAFSRLVQQQATERRAS